jgi:hypothetical protein
VAFFLAAAWPLYRCRHDADCPKRNKPAEREAWKHDLEVQHAKAAESHPELAAIRAAQEAELKDSGAHVAIADRPRAKKEEDGQR